MNCALLSELRRADERFDVVIAGAIVEHLSHPVSALGALERLAQEAVIIPFISHQFCRPMTF